MLEHSASITNFSAAFLLAQGAMRGAGKDSKNPAFKSSYASLEAVIDAGKPHLQANGIAFLQAPGRLIDGAIEMTTMLIHAASGEWVKATMHVPLVKRDPQGVGSATTYAERYSLMALLGLPPVDDDGESAGKAHSEQRGASPPPPPPAGAKPMLQAEKRVLWGELRDELNACQSDEALMTLWESKKFVAETHNLKEADWDFLVEHKDALRAHFAKLQHGAVDPRAQFDAMLEREPPPFISQEADSSIPF